jgi:hypothetical protein
MLLNAGTGDTAEQRHVEVRDGLALGVPLCCPNAQQQPGVEH